MRVMAFGCIMSLITALISRQCYVTFSNSLKIWCFGSCSYSLYGIRFSAATREQTIVVYEFYIVVICLVFTSLSSGPAQS